MPDQNSKPRVLLIITQDSKGEEATFIRGVLDEAGVAVVMMDPSIRRIVGGAEIGPEAIAAAAGQTIEQVRALGHEGKCQAVMIEGALKLAHEAHAATPFSGILSVGGSMGTTLSTTIMRSFPYGIPKVMVSTMASGFTAPFVGVKDITMMNAVTDVAGINSISRDVYRNAANAVAGMAKGYRPTAADARPLALMTTLSTTEKTTARIRRALEADGVEVMVFHSSGAGGPTLDAIAAERDVKLVLDLSWTEILDRLNGGLCAAGPERGTIGLARGVPTIFAPGNIDFIIAGPIDQAEKQFPGRRYHEHNPALTAVRTGLAELTGIADHMASIVADVKSPVSFFVPLKGFSNHDSPEGHIHEPSLPPPFGAHLARVMPAHVPVTQIDAHFNDEAFADAIIAQARAYLKPAQAKPAQAKPAQAKPA